ncbi:hypothetical protein ACO0LM_04520 [Undibacterium sp. Di26W]|uniref:hypothetical protein n=1 Tax=Undibacterium sp. Di26W TaxID=3413035 RepID=UPI003BF03851
MYVRGKSSNSPTHPKETSTIDVFIAGRIYGQVEERAGQNGSVYVTCKVRAATDNGDFIICNVIAFNDAARATLLSLGDADSLSLSGALTPKVWTGKQGKANTGSDCAHRDHGTSGYARLNIEQGYATRTVQ